MLSVTHAALLAGPRLYPCFACVFFFFLIRRGRFCEGSHVCRMRRTQIVDLSVTDRSFCTFCNAGFVDCVCVQGGALGF